MPMTRELKKRFMGIDDRIEKLEKRKPSPRTNGADPLVTAEDETGTRLDNIEAVLQIPGEKVGDTQVLSAWRQVVETILKKLEDRILQVELRASWTVDEGKTLDARVKTLWDRPSADSFKVFIKMIDERVLKLEQIPDPASDVTTALEKQVRDLQTRDRMLTKEMNDNRPTLKKHEERLHNLEVKPVAGNLSNILQDVTLEIEGNTRDMKDIKSKNSLVHLLLLSLIILLFGISLLT